MNNDIDLEQAIMTVWSTVDDLKLFAEAYYDGPKEMTVDETYNHVAGIICMFELRLEKLDDTYKRKFELDQYCTDPVKLAAREALFKPKKGKKK